MTQVTVNGNTYSDDGTTAKDMLGKGYATHFFPLLNDTMVRVEDAEDAAVAADASADAAAAYAAAIIGTSTSSIAVGSGSKTFTTQSGKQFATGQKVVVARTSAPTTTWMYGEVTSYSSTTLIVSVSDYLGSGTYTDWTISISGIKGATGTSGASAPRLAITGATTLGASDKGKRVVVTSGTFTLTFSACSVLTSGWYAWIENKGTGLVTVDPNSTEQIDGVTSFVMYPSECRFVYCDGSALYSVLEKPFDYTWTSSGSIVVPPGYRAVGCQLIAGGNGGNAGARKPALTVSPGGDGGGGGSAQIATFGVTSGETLTVTVGAGGAGAAGRTTDGDQVTGIGGGSTQITDGTNVIAESRTPSTAGKYSGTSYVGVGIRSRFVAAIPVVGTIINGLYGGYGGTGGNTGGDGYSAYNTANETSMGMGGPGGGGGGGVTSAPANGAGGAGGLKTSATQGGGGAAGTAGGGAGGTAENSGGGGGGGNNAGAGGTGGAGTGYGSGGGGGGGVQGAYTSGAGGAGAGGMARLWGVI